MRIVYAYNEILPTNKAHDVFIAHECAAFANLGWDVTLLSGKGQSKYSIWPHYHISSPPTLHHEPLFILRKNNLLNLSWNLPFFWQCQRYLRTTLPDYVFFSVRKQSAFHCKHKIATIRYVYEVHELSWYPTQTGKNSKEFAVEKHMLDQVDLITVTTGALKQILLNPPYSIKTPIEIIPLAVHAQTLPPPAAATPLVIMYVGQLYRGQGLHHLLHALKQTQDILLKIVGGSPKDIAILKEMAKTLHLENRVQFLGFVAPEHLPAIVKEAHAFVAPFENTGRMPYVAHTKLFEYAEWGRPIIAPRLPIVEEHFHKNNGALLFEPDDSSSLAECLNTLKNETERQKLQSAISFHSGKYSWQNRALAYRKIFKIYSSDLKS